MWELTGILTLDQKLSNLPWLRIASYDCRAIF